ncbi:MAG: glycerophosphodiester phosphodiesterase [Gammaproteobacteria bacterium]|nr:glycerophosphodiester phosphodiesterase [Gammaproteobacteria bacterium]
MSRPPVVIAHRGASGYLPEHTLPAKALAHGMGADFLEQDVIGTRDGQLIVFHDLHLDQLTDVARQFPGRARADGLHYCIDFTLAEIRTLRLTERRRRIGSGARFPGRFPLDTGSFRIHTLEDELEFIRGLNQSTGRQAGVYAEIKDPAWHEQHGFPLGDRLIETLRAFGYKTHADNFYIQCFDGCELRRVRTRFGAEVPLIQLLEKGAVLSRESLTGVGEYAHGIGPALGMAWPDRGLVGTARDLGLVVHPYTFRADELPPGFKDFNALLTTFIDTLQVEGVFTDFPDLVVRYLHGRA